MARASKYTLCTVTGHYLGPNFPVIPIGIMSNVNALLVKQEYRKCESTFDSNSLIDLEAKCKETVSLKVFTFFVQYNFFV